jgi:hypothetical protein
LLLLKNKQMFTLNIKIQDFQRMENFEKTFDKSGAVRIKQEYENREPSKFTNLYQKYRSKSTI